MKGACFFSGHVEDGIADVFEVAWAVPHILNLFVCWERLKEQGCLDSTEQSMGYKGVDEP